MANDISKEQAEELRQLYAELADAHEAAMEALRAVSPNYFMEGAAAARFEAAEERVAAIVRQIRTIQGS